jgi:hypothetical protein
MSKWLSTGFLKAAPAGRIDDEQGIIEGVKVCTEGEASGHGVHLDSEFIQTVVKFGNEKKQGLKARFGHPNMCSTALGTFIGRHKNFREQTTVRDDGSKALTAVADLFLSNEAKGAPGGDLHTYILGLAKNEPDMFGESIVFTPGREYRKTSDGDNAYVTWQTGPDGKELFDEDGLRLLGYVDKDGKPINPKETPLSEEIYVECAALHACDCVDDPAANDGLFSKFAGETVAGQITEFLDLHPQVWGAVSGNPDILAAIAKHGDRVAEFIAKYSEYNSKQKKEIAMNPKPNSEKLDKTEDAPPPAASETSATEATPAEPAVKPEANATPAEPVQPDPEADKFARAEFKALVDEFGAEIAAKVTLSGGGKEEALALKAQAAEDRVKALESENADLRKELGKGGTPAKPSAEAKGKKSIWS